MFPPPPFGHVSAQVFSACLLQSFTVSDRTVAVYLIFDILPWFDVGDVAALLAAVLSCVVLDR